MNNYRIIDGKKYDINEAMLLFETNWGATKYYWCESGYFHTHTNPPNVGMCFYANNVDETKEWYGKASYVHTPYEEMFQINKEAQ